MSELKPFLTNPIKNNATSINGKIWKERRLTSVLSQKRKFENPISLTRATFKTFWENKLKRMKQHHICFKLFQM